jgi:hypothetical protein
MRPLHVLLVVKDTPASYDGDDKLSGLFSYSVPEFTWGHTTLGDDFDLDTRKYQGRFDLIFHIDGSNWGRYRGPVPVVYWGIDSTLSEEHYRARREQARESDLVLVEHDELVRYSSLMPENACSGPVLWRPGDRQPAPVRRFPYCVNDRLFKLQDVPHVDIGWHAHTTGIGKEERQWAWGIVSEHARVRGYTMADYTAGDRHHYAAALGSARVIFSWPRVLGNRPHRILDAMMCGSCVVSGPVPDCGDGLAHGVNIMIARDPEHACDLIDGLLADNLWRSIGNEARRLAFSEHRWSVRAAQLRALLADTWPQRFGPDAE